MGLRDGLVDRGQVGAGLRTGHVDDICKATATNSQGFGIDLWHGKLQPRLGRWGIVTGWQTPGQLSNLAALGK